MIPADSMAEFEDQVWWFAKTVMQASAAARSLSVGTVAPHQHPIQAAMLAVIVIEAGFMQ